MTQRSKIFIGYIALVVICASYRQAGATPQAQPTAANEQKHPASPDMAARLLRWVDLFHRELSKGVLKTSETLDAFFGDERLDEEPQKSEITIKTALTAAQDDKMDLTFSLGAYLAFPHLQEKLHFMVDTLLKNNLDAEEDADTEDREITVGLRYKILEQARRLISLDGGIKIHSDDIVEPFGRLRVKRIFDADPWAFRLTQFLTVYERDGFGEVSRVDIERRIQQHSLLRIISKGSWTEQSDNGVEFQHSWSLRRQLSRNRAIGVTLTGIAHTKPMLAVDRYSATLAFRRRLYKHWVFLAVYPEAQFLREDDFAFRPLITGQLEFRIGGRTQR